MACPCMIITMGSAEPEDENRASLGPGSPRSTPPSHSSLRCSPGRPPGTKASLYHELLPAKA